MLFKIIRSTVENIKRRCAAEGVGDVISADWVPTTENVSALTIRRPPKTNGAAKKAKNKPL